MFDPMDWLESGQAAVVDGLALRPQPHPYSARMVLSAGRGQAIVYCLCDDAQREWMLKKFRPGSVPDDADILAVQSLVPREKGFEAAFQRRVVRARMVSRSGFAPPEFLDWIDGTLLMPRVTATDWSEVVDSVRDGKDLALGDRLTLAENLCKKIEVLERARLAHRDLSGTNVMIGISHDIHLIDWDSLYAPSLQIPDSTITGTNGYTAPFVQERNGDPATTWCAEGDRFALAVLILEAFAVAPGCPMAADGALLEQTELDARGGLGIRQALAAAAQHTNAIEPLFLQALHARAAGGCPSPADWMRSLRGMAAATGRQASPQPVSGNFVPLDPRVFTPLDHSRFTPLSMKGKS